MVRVEKLIRFFKFLIILSAPLVLVYFSLNIKMPVLYKIRQWEFHIFGFLIFINLIIVITGLKTGLDEGNRKSVLFSFIIAISVLVSSANFIVACMEHSKVRRSVLAENPNTLEKFGRHFVVGYRQSSFEDIKELVTKKAISGIFITTRNVKGRKIEEIRNDIEILQRIQRGNGLSELIIATDQEGGIVSRCSPPLKVLPSLSEVVENCKNNDELEFRIKRYADIQSRELSYLGINLNFSPVVDLKDKSIRHGLNLHTRIDLRAISTNKDIVTKVALIYSLMSEKNGVKTTLKHFPGLCSVNEDTHLFTGSLNHSEKYLSINDWVPFREVSKQTNSFIMLGHVMIKSMDSKNPVSSSKKIIKKVIRKRWEHDGILITDDLNMGPCVKGDGGIGGYSVRALNAGVDLLLLSYDGEQYYKAMRAVIDADKRGTINNIELAKSRSRLVKFRMGEKICER